MNSVESSLSLYHQNNKGKKWFHALELRGGRRGDGERTLSRVQIPSSPFLLTPPRRLAACLSNIPHPLLFLSRIKLPLTVVLCFRSVLLIYLRRCCGAASFLKRSLMDVSEGEGSKLITWSISNLSYTGFLVRLPSCGESVSRLEQSSFNLCAR